MANNGIQKKLNGQVRILDEYLPLVWNFDAGTTDNVTPTEFRLNNADQTLATFIYVNTVTRPTFSAAEILDSLSAGDIVLITNTNSDRSTATYTVSGDVVDGTSGKNIPVTFTSAGANPLSGVDDGGAFAFEFYKASVNNSELERLIYATPLDRQDVFLTTSVGNVFFEMEKIGGGDVRFDFAGTIFTLDCTTGAGAGGRAQVQFTEGTSSTAIFNYAYVEIVASVATLKASTAYPVAASGFSIVAVANIKSDTEVAADGAQLFQRYTDSPSHDNRGRESYIGEKLRLNADYESGIAQTGLITPNGGAADNVDLTAADGIVYQMHRNTWSALQVTIDSCWVANASGLGTLTKLQKMTDLNQALEITDGTAITNNQRFNLVIWGAINSDGQSKLFCNLSTGIYANDANAYSDLEGKSVTSVPVNQKQTAFLICRIPLKYQTAASGTWTFIGSILGKDDVISLLGTPIGGSGQGSATTSSSKTIFSDYIIGSTSGPNTIETTSALAPVIAEMTKTFTPDSATNKIEVNVSCSFSNSGDQTAIMAIFIDGVIQAETEMREYCNAGVFSGSINTFWQGTHATSSMTITARMWTSGGTLTAIGVLRNMIVKEIRE